MTTNITSIPKQEEGSFEANHILTIVGGHFLHDTYSAFVSPLLPLLIDKLSLSLTLAGSLSAFTQFPSLLNPFIGYLDDRVNLRFLVITAPAITATLISFMGLAPNYASLTVLFLITGLSIAAFHAPAPAMIARISGKQIGKGMSLFMAGGEMGRTIGPIFAIWAVSLWTLEGMYRIAILGWLASAVLFLRFREIPARSEKRTSFRQVIPTARRLFTPLIFILMARNLLVSSIGVFLPTYLAKQGASLFWAGGALSIYELAGVGGALLSGTMSDRLGRKPVIFSTILISSLLMQVFIRVDGWLIIPVLIPLGFVALSTQPVMLAIVQDHMPNHRSTANGLFLAMSFIIRPIMTILFGVLGDLSGLQSAFSWSALAALVSAPLVFTLPKPPTDP